PTAARPVQGARPAVTEPPAEAAQQPAPRPPAAGPSAPAQTTAPASPPNGSSPGGICVPIVGLCLDGPAAR
ncbi:hypothetical protein KUF83_02725, partial [Streptomyces sp. BV286]|nr:hypothetical protein [Streptomyces sp. BV286]